MLKPLILESVHSEIIAEYIQIVVYFKGQLI